MYPSPRFVVDRRRARFAPRLGLVAFASSGLAQGAAQPALAPATAPVRTVYLGSKLYFAEVNAGYCRKVTLRDKPVRWSLLANINNLLNNDAFVRLRPASDGQLLNYQFNPPLEWTLLAKICF